MKRGGWLLVVAAVVLTGCGMLGDGRQQDLPRPSFPDLEPFPGVVVEEVVADLEARAFDCWFDPGGDISSSWSCHRGDQAGGDWTSVRISSAESGAMTAVGIELSYPRAFEPSILDEDAATRFRDLSSVVIPDAIEPELDAIWSRVAANHVLDVGDGWWMVFDRNSQNRRTLIRYHAPNG